MAGERVVLVGSSFVKRLHQDLLAGSRFQRDFGLDIEVHYICKGGWKLSDLELAMGDIAALSPDYIFIQCGANDLSNVPYGETVGMQMVDIAELLKLRTGAKEVCLAQCMYRQVGRYIHSQQAERTFNVNCLRANRYLQVVAPDQGVLYWHHKGLMNPRASGFGDTLGQDGVHLSPRGQYKFYKSVKGAIVHMRNKHRGPRTGW